MFKPSPLLLCLYCFVLSTLWLGFFQQYVSSPILNVIDDALFFMLIGLSISYQKIFSFNFKSISLVFSLVLVFGIIISTMSGESKSALLLSLRQYKCALFFVIVPLVSGQTDLGRTLFKHLGFILWVSLPLSVFQFLAYDDVDAVTGAFGGSSSGTLSLLIIFYVVVNLDFRLSAKASVFGRYLALLLPVCLNETKITFVILPLILVIVYARRGKLNLFSVLMFGLMFSFLVVGIDFIYKAVYSRSYLDFFTLSELERYFFEFNDVGDVGRLQRIVVAFEYLRHDSIFSLLFGQGLGSSYHGASTGIQGVAAQSLDVYRMNEGSRIQLYHFILDFGLVGSFLICFVVAKLFVSSYFDVTSRYATHCLCLCLLFLVGIVYQNILTNRVMSMFIFLYFYIYQFHLSRKK